MGTAMPAYACNAGCIRYVPEFCPPAPGSMLLTLMRKKFRLPARARPDQRARALIPLLVSMALNVESLK
jgi:hypothetical protein